MSFTGRRRQRFRLMESLLMVLSGHFNDTSECPLLGVKRT